MELPEPELQDPRITMESNGKGLNVGVSWHFSLLKSFGRQWFNTEN